VLAFLSLRGWGRLGVFGLRARLKKQPITLLRTLRNSEDRAMADKVNALAERKRELLAPVRGGPSHRWTRSSAHRNSHSLGAANGPDGSVVVSGSHLARSLVSGTPSHQKKSHEWEKLLPAGESAATRLGVFKLFRRISQSGTGCRRLEGLASLTILFEYEPPACRRLFPPKIGLRTPIAVFRPQPSYAK